MGMNYVMLGDGRWLCLECMESAVMDTYEVQPLHFEIREFFEGLNMKIEKEFHLLLVEKEALKKAEEKEKIVSTFSNLKFHLSSLSLSLTHMCCKVLTQAGLSAWGGNQRYLPE